MGRKKLGLEKVTINLYEGQKASINDFYPHTGHNHVIRELVEAHLNRLREVRNKQNSAASQIIKGDINE